MKNTLKGGRGRGKTIASFPTHGGGEGGGAGRGRCGRFQGRGGAAANQPKPQPQPQDQEDIQNRPDPALHSELITGRKKRRRKLVPGQIKRLQKSTKLLISKVQMTR